MRRITIVCIIAFLVLAGVSSAVFVPFMYDDGGTYRFVHTGTLASVSDYSPPIGIPAPPFGINETYRIYDDDADPNVRNAALTYHENAEGGYYTHYIDNTDPNATDNINPYGTIATPRLSLPLNLPDGFPAGSVVEIHGGPYTSGDTLNVIVDGNSTSPIFIRGEPDTLTHWDREIRLMGSYAILENLDMNDVKVGIRAIYQAGAYYWGDYNTYISVRNMEIKDGGVEIDPNATNIVVYNSHLWEHGDPNADGDDDKCSVTAAGKNCTYIWVLDNEMHHNGGDSVAMGHTAGQTSGFFYIGRNIMYGDGENAVDFKDVHDVIVSQNTMYDYPTRNDSSNGIITVCHDGISEPDSLRGTRRAWFLFNEMYDCSEQANTISVSDEIYYIGNLIYDANGAAFSASTPNDIGIFNNTTYNTGEGVHVTSGTGDVITIINNIFGSLQNPNDDHIDLHANYINDAVVSNNLYQDPMNINVSSSNDVNNVDPNFTDSASYDFSLQATSDAIGAGISSGAVQTAFDRFETLYGIDITVDYAGNDRVDPWDIGAYED